MSLNRYLKSHTLQFHSVYQSDTAFLIILIKEKRIDVTKQYTNWFKIGCALAYEFGEDGRYWFHIISRMYEKYNEGDCDMQYNKCLKYKRNDGVKIGTFFYLCRQCGINI